MRHAAFAAVLILIFLASTLWVHGTIAHGGDVQQQLQNAHLQPYDASNGSIARAEVLQDAFSGHGLEAAVTMSRVRQSITTASLRLLCA